MGLKSQRWPPGWEERRAARGNRLQAPWPLPLVTVQIVSIGPLSFLPRGEDPSRITVFAGIDLPSRLTESLLENDPISTGVGILRRLENANDSIPPYTVYRED